MHSVMIQTYRQVNLDIIIVVADDMISKKGYISPSSSHEAEITRTGVALSQSWDYRAVI